MFCIFLVWILSAQAGTLYALFPALAVTWPCTLHSYPWDKCSEVFNNVCADLPWTEMNPGLKRQQQDGFPLAGPAGWGSGLGHSWLSPVRTPFLCPCS